MKKTIFQYTIAAIASVMALAACKSDPGVDGNALGEDAIRLKGAITRAGTLNDLPLYLVAYHDDDPSRQYFAPTLITSQAILTENPQDLSFYSTQRYYPLGGREINLISYSGDLYSATEMHLKSGNTIKNDYVLSNYGKRVSDADIEPLYEGLGTPGSSTYPAEILQYRHVMTQLTVEVKIDENQTNPVDTLGGNVQFKIDGAYAQGAYPLRAKTPQVYIDAAQTVEVASPVGTAEVQLSLGTQYIVPTGINLVGRNFSELIIDNYKATTADLADIKVTAPNGEDEMWLYPGYAYKMTLLVQKLRLVGVQIVQVPWVERPVDGHNPSYDANALTLDITGGYDNTGEDRISKMVLHTTSGFQYVGDADSLVNNVINYVTLPQGDLTSVDIYTDQGFLLTVPLEAGDYDFATGTLSFNLPETGMLLEGPGANSPTNRYIISTPAQFLNVNKDLGGHYVQADDIELEEPGVLSRDFTGFGPFYGSYEGNGHWIGNVTFNAAGLFAENHGSLVNIRLYTGNIDLSGYNYAGAICGVNYGLIYACLNEVALHNAPGTVGGICGLNESTGRVIATVNTGNIRAGDIVGGIAGENRNTSERAFAACLAIGNIGDVTPTIAGAIVGLSVDSVNEVIATCFWLQGSAQAMPGEEERAVGQGDVGLDDSTELDPVKMRNGRDVGMTDDDLVLNRLNAEVVNVMGPSPEFVFVLEEELTGITWPMAFDTNQVP